MARVPWDVEPIIVDVWSDIACPWCFIGRRRLQAAIAAHAEADDALPVQVTYHSFELSPDTPVDFEGTSSDFLAQHRGLPVEDARAMNVQMTELAAQDGLAFDVERTQHTNTRRAHEVLHLARDRGVQDAVVERLFRAYWEEGRHVGRDDELADLAAEAGLDRADVLEALADHRFAAAVEGDVAQAAAYGIRGVPFFVIDGRYGISGAQPAQTLQAGLAQASSDRTAS